MIAVVAATGLTVLLGVALLGGLFGLVRLLDWRCARCLERDPDDPYCGE